MKKNRDRLNLFCSKLELRVKNASWYDGVNVCLFSFLLAMRIVSQRYIMRDDLTIDSNCVTALYHPWRLDDRFFIFNCKKDQNNTVDLSETTSFKAVKTLSGQCAIRLKTYRVVWAKRQQVRFATFTSLAIVAWRGMRLVQLFSPFLRQSYCGVILLHVAKVWAARFAVHVFLAFLKEFGRAEYNHVFAPDIWLLQTPWSKSCYC